MKSVTIMLSRAAREQSMRWIVLNGVTGQSRTHASAHVAMMNARRWFAENEILLQKTRGIMDAAAECLDGAA